ncbi:putative trans-sialidase, Group VI [Trypanosoma cruzi]|nr:putative trans-sialidase, Group VI [Trypanosoma cruzi]
MLSRVAAVKAPRTHNRRCVTGSSGRRREGGESETQRPDMSRHLFCFAVLLLIVVMMCCNTVGGQQADVRASGPGTSLGKHFVWRDKKEEEKVSLLYAPSLLVVNGKVFAVAEAQCTENDKVFTGITSELLTLGKKQTVEELDASKVKTQVLLECPSDKEKCASQSEEKDVSQSEAKVRVSRPTTVVKENDIYMLVGKYSPTAVVVPPKNDAEDCGLLLVKGEVGGESSDIIIWGDTAGVPSISTVEKEKVGLTRLIGGGGSGVKMHDDTLVFPVQAVKKEESGKTVSLLIYTLKDTNTWTLSKGMSEGGCSGPSVVEWEKDQLIMMTACDDGRRRVYESGDMGESWTEALGTLSRVWGNKQKDEEVKAVRSGFITATIDGDDNRNVMLVTLPVYSEDESKKETGNGKGKLHLWLTDNTHIVDIGPVSDDDAAASSLLYKSGKDGDNEQKEELIALYEKKKKGDGKPSHSLWSVLLTEQLQRVKDVLATWKKVDETVSKLCPSSAEEDASSDTACSPTVKITDGLVGFLSGNFFDGTWRDEYLGVNATVKNNDGATKTSDGVKFAGAWAEWPVGSQGENQLYHFANYNFTLVATVSIHNEPKEDIPIPLLGVRAGGDDGKNLMGLSYDKEKKWQVLCSGEQNKEHSSTWEKDTKHQVVLMLRNGTQGSMYVNGQPVLGDAQCDLKNTKDKKISHFYIGGDGSSVGGADNKEGVTVTVTNVLLYNRPLDGSEITALNPNKVPIPPVVPDNAQGTSLQSLSDGQAPSGPGSLNENQGAGGGRASPSEPSTVTTSGEESVKQSALRASPGGSKHVDVASSSDGDQRVGTEAGGTEQGDTPPQTPVDTPDTADTNAPIATDVAQVDPADTTEVGASSDANGDTVRGTTVQEEGVHARDGEVKAVALSSSLGNVSQGNNSDAGTVRGSGLLPSLPLLLGLWVFAAL